MKNLYQSFCIIHSYAPTCDKDDAAVDRFYGDLERAPKKIKHNEKVFVMADFNAKVGNLAEKPAVSLHEIGNRNDRGDIHVDWCQVNSFALWSMMLQKP